MKSEKRRGGFYTEAVFPPWGKLYTDFENGGNYMLGRFFLTGGNVFPRGKIMWGKVYATTPVLVTAIEQLKNCTGGYNQSSKQ
jgi:hypothetical protein